MCVVKGMMCVYNIVYIYTYAYTLNGKICAFQNLCTIYWKYV